MILIVSENAHVEGGLSDIVQGLYYDNTKARFISGRYDEEPDYDTTEPLAPPGCVNGALAYFRLCGQGHFPEEPLIALVHSSYRKYIEEMTKSKPEFTLGWGGATPRSRALMYASYAMGVPYLSIETPLLPCMEDEYVRKHHFVCFKNKPYFEMLPEEFTSWRQWDYDEGYMEHYYLWWKGNKKTKPSHEGKVVAKELPNGFPVRAPVIFGQVYHDAATLWQPLCGDWKRMVRDGKASGAWAKPHPMDPLPERWDATGLPLINPRLSIHSVLPRCSCAVTRNSNVGMEAFFYHKPVAAYSRAIYRQPGLACKSVAEALASEPDHEARKQFLHYLLTHHDVVVETGITAKLRRIAQE